MSVLDRFRLNNKRLFITGGSRGLPGFDELIRYDESLWPLPMPAG